MALSKVPWLLIGFSFLLVSTSAVRFPAVGSGNLGDAGASNARSNLTAPTAPAGIRVELRYSPNRGFFSILGMYLCAVKLMYDLTASPWDQIVKNHEMTHESYDVKISIKNNLLEGSAFPLRTSHVISSLLSGINDMSLWSKYFGLTILITHQNQEIGSIFIGKETDNPSLSVTTSQDETPNVKFSALNPLGFSGDIIIDPSNPRLKITYDLDGGRIVLRDAFLMILDGFATAAEFAESTRCGSFHALHPEAHAVFHIGQGFSTRFDLTYNVIIRILFLLWVEAILSKTGFYQMSFQVFFDVEQVAQGSITRLSVSRGDHLPDTATA